MTDAMFKVTDAKKNIKITPSCVIVDEIGLTGISIINHLKHNYP